MKKRIFSLLLTLCMVLSLLPAAALAEESAATLPNAVFAELTPLTLKSGEYDVWNGSLTAGTTDRPLQIVANFKTNDIYETRAEAKTHPYSQYLVDFYLTISDLGSGSITADNCYLAGNYGTFGWIVIPADGLVIQNGVEYPVVSNYDSTLKYEDICVAVQNFTAAIYIDESILEANPNMQVTLALKMTNPENTTDVYTAGSYTWTAAALLRGTDIAGMSPEDQEFILGLDEAEQEFVLGLDEADQEFFLGLDETTQEIVLGVSSRFGSDAGKIALEALKLSSNTALTEANTAAIADVEEVETLDVTLADVVMEEGSDVPTLVYEVNPLSATGEKVSNPSSAITFRLPVPDEIGNTYDYANVTHDGEPMGTYPILGAEGGYYVEVTSQNFSEFAVEPVDVDEPAAVNVAEVNDTGYETLQAAINAASTGDTVKLLQDISLTENDCVENADRKVLFDVVDKDITLNMNGKKISVVHEDAFTNEYIVAVVRVADGAGLTVTGNGTIDVKVLAENPDIAYMFWKRGTTGHLTIENGTYHMNDSADSMVYTNGNEIVNIKGGTWKLDAYGTRSNREPWIFNVQGAGDNHVVVTGGTFNTDINRQYWSNEVVVPETHYTVDNGDGTWTVEEGAVAYVNEGMLTGPYFVRKNIGYATLADAVNAADDNEAVTLLQDITLTKGTDSEQYVKKQITIDLNSYTLTSTGMRTLVAYGSNAELTVQNGTISSDTSGALTATYNGKLILGKDLTVTSTGNYGLYVNRGKLEVPAGTTGLSVKGATKAIWYKAHDDNEMYVAAGKYSTAPIGLAEGYGVVVNSGWYEVIAPVQYINEEGQLSSAANLQEAIDNAADGSTITLNTDFYLYANKLTSKAKTEGTDLVAVDGQYGAFFLVEEKTLTIDLNGHNLLGYTRSAPTMVIGMFVTDNNGHLTLKDSVGDALVRITAQNANVYALITNYEDDCSITIEGGTYKLDKASDSLIYSAASANEGEGDQGIVVNGGTFELGNIGTGANYGPWIFNAKGQNHRHVWVTGGTFNADINHQYWTFEAQLPETLAVKANGDGTWTVVEAVAYVTESHGSFVKNVGYATMEEAEAGLEGAYRPYTYYKQPSADEKIVLLTEISTSDDLQNVVSGSDVVVNVTLAAGSYTMPTTSGDITISGTKDTVISGNDATAKNVTFEGVTIQSTGAAYTGIKHSEKVVYNGVTIIGNMYLYAKEVVFENCTFDLSGTNDYIWVYGATNVTFKNCTFNTMGKAILVFQDGSQVDQTVTVESCTFNASQAANTWNGIHISAVSIDGSQGGTYNVILNNNTVDSDFNGLWQDKTGAGNITVTVDGTTELSAN